jgi:hypothetical protein
VAAARHSGGAHAAPAPASPNARWSVIKKRH